MYNINQIFEELFHINSFYKVKSNQSHFSSWVFLMTLLPRPVATCYLDLWTPIKARIETGGKERNGRQHKIHNLGRWEHTWGKTVFFLEQRYLWATWIFGSGPLKYIIQRSHMTDHHLYCEYVHWLKLTGWSSWPIRGRWVRSITQIKSDPTHLTLYVTIPCLWISDVVNERPPPLIVILTIDWGFGRPTWLARCVRSDSINDAGGDEIGKSKQGLRCRFVWWLLIRYWRQHRLKLCFENQLPLTKLNSSIVKS